MRCASACVPVHVRWYVLSQPYVHACVCVSACVQVCVCLCVDTCVCVRALCARVCACVCTLARVHPYLCVLGHGGRSRKPTALHIRSSTQAKSIAWLSLPIYLHMWGCRCECVCICIVWTSVSCACTLRTIAVSVRYPDQEQGQFKSIVQQLLLRHAQRCTSQHEPA